MLAVLRYGVKMNISKRQVKVFALGIVIGVIAVSGATMLRRPSGLFSSPVSEMPKASLQTTQSAPSVSEQFAPCPSQPIAPAAGAKDGRFFLQTDLSGNKSTDAASFMVVGKEAAAAGRPRDAEVAFMMSCRVAEKSKGSGSVEAADAKYQLGWHYEWLARDASSAAQADRSELLRRAESLYSDSLKAYRAAYGDVHEKSQFAADGLASVRQILALGPTTVPAPGAELQPENPAQATEARAAAGPAGSDGQRISKPVQSSQPFRPPQRKVELAQATAPAVSKLQAPIAPQVPRPSFDCAKARSIPEKMICSDAELARLDRDLGRVYARAKSATPDAAAFRRRNNDEWRLREATCRDRECLLRWYAHRRNQLTNGVD